MKTVELYARVRHAVMIEGISERGAADRFGINARTVSKMLKVSVPPGYVRTPLPAPYDACDKKPGSVNSLSLVRYRLNDYAVPTAFGHQKVLVRGLRA